MWYHFCATNYIVYYSLFNFDSKNRDKLIVYLPPTYDGPDNEVTPKELLEDEANAEKPVSRALPPYLQNLPTPLVRINYCYHGIWNSTHTLHSAAEDALRAYSVIKKELCIEKTKVVVHGRYLGAPMALSLALYNSIIGTTGVFIVPYCFYFFTSKIE